MERYAEIYRAICSTVHVQTLTMILVVCSPTAVSNFIKECCIFILKFEINLLSHKINRNNDRVYNKSKRV